MLQSLDFISEQQLSEWIRQHVQTDQYALSSGYQGKTLLYQENNHKLVIKVPLGNFLTRPLNRALLRHEYRIYQKLAGMTAVPHCYGMANNECLVLEFIEGQTIRQQRPATDSDFYNKLLAAIREMHTRGVAHFDLKRKENLLVTADERPVIIDFGVAVYRKGGLHLLNRYLFNLALKFDYNAYARHKYNRRMEHISEQDRAYYNKTAIEIISKKIKRFYKDRILQIFK